MATDFAYDVFLSHSSKDKAVVRPLAERLRKDGVKVWLDEWEIRPGDSIPAKIEEGLERSRMLVLCMSENAFGSDWAQLESGTFRFRDPLNKERRFLPLRLDHAPIKGSLAQFLYIDWRPANRGQEYTKLLEACLPAIKSDPPASHVIRLPYQSEINMYAFSADGKYALTGAHDCTVKLWDLTTAQEIRSLKANDNITAVALSGDRRIALSGSCRGLIQIWDLTLGRCLQYLNGHSDIVWSLEWSSDERYVLSSSWDETIRLWEIKSGRCVRIFRGHQASVQRAL